MTSFCNSPDPNSLQTCRDAPGHAGRHTGLYGQWAQEKRGSTVYDPASVTVTFNGVKIKGIATGTFIHVDNHMPNNISPFLSELFYAGVRAQRECTTQDLVEAKFKALQVSLSLPYMQQHAYDLGLEPEDLGLLGWHEDVKDDYGEVEEEDAGRPRPWVPAGAVVDGINGNVERPNPWKIPAGTVVYGTSGECADWLDDPMAENYGRAASTWAQVTPDQIIADINNWSKALNEYKDEGGALTNKNIVPISNSTFNFLTSGSYMNDVTKVPPAYADDPQSYMDLWNDYNRPCGLTVEQWRDQLAKDARVKENVFFIRQQASIDQSGWFSDEIPTLRTRIKIKDLETRTMSVSRTITLDTEDKDKDQAFADMVERVLMRQSGNVTTQTSLVPAFVPVEVSIAGKEITGFGNGEQIRIAGGTSSGNGGTCTTSGGMGGGGGGVVTIPWTQAPTMKPPLPATPLWSCSSYDCPDKPPQSCTAAPTCYTCGCRMDRVDK